MAVRTRMSPGVEWKEIDKSGYSPTMAGTSVYLKGFSSKGEAYKPVMVTTRSAFEQIFGAPDTEAERYFYAGACEVLNQGGRLFCARLPYDNAAFEKMVGVKYVVEYGSQLSDLSDLLSVQTYTSALVEADPELNEIAIIRGGNTPVLYDLSSIDEFSNDEAKVPANTFLIVDTTGATYNRVIEDTRKGQKREVIGIIPVVTTAANAMYAQNYIDIKGILSDYNKFESLCGDTFLTLNALCADGSPMEIDGVKMNNDGLLSSDLVSYIACDSYFHDIEKLSVNILSTNAEAEAAILSALQDLTADMTSLTSDGKNMFDNERAAINMIPYVAAKLGSLESDFAASSLFEGSIPPSSDGYCIVSAIMAPLNFDSQYNDLDNLSSTSSDVIAKLERSGYDIEELNKQFGWHGLNMDDTPPSTIASEAASFFPTIQPSPDGTGLDPEHLKDIGVVIYKAYLDPSEGNKVSVEPVEAYAGSLFKEDKDPNTGVTKFIDTIINTQSQYIKFFSNCFSAPAAKKYYKESCDILLAPPSSGACLGLYSPMTKKDISISRSILDGMNKAFDKVSDINEREIDIVPDAGLANIASYIKAIFGEKGPYDLSITDSLGNSLLGMWTCKKAADPWVKMWKTIILKHDNFCKNIRKDCMFIADGLRPLVLAGQKKIVRDTKPSNTIDKDILPYIPAICGINTNFGAGYADWFEQADDYTGDFFWCPPSIKATGCYINTDLNFDYWLAPAGLTRGIITATDVAFSPNDKQAGAFYEKNWNYAVNYPQDGIILEGQKTFQTKPTALDRVNVRRTMLRLERQVYKVLRYFVYENNTAYIRQRIVDAIDPILRSCWQSGNGGIARYKIVCDESNNTPNVIDNNELKIAIGVIPNKSAEYIMVDWILGASGATWEELF